MHVVQKQPISVWVIYGPSCSNVNTIYFINPNRYKHMEASNFQLLCPYIKFIFPKNK
jgi:hypothetical protein